MKRGCLPHQYQSLCELIARKLEYLMRIIWYHQLQQHSWTSTCVETHTQREVAHHEASMQRTVQEYWGRAWVGEEGRGGQKRSTIQHETVFYVYRILQYACQCTVQVLCTKNIYDKVISHQVCVGNGGTCTHHCGDSRGPNKDTKKGMEIRMLAAQIQ